MQDPFCNIQRNHRITARRCCIRHSLPRQRSSLVQCSGNLPRMKYRHFALSPSTFSSCVLHYYPPMRLGPNFSKPVSRVLTALCGHLILIALFSHHYKWYNISLGAEPSGIRTRGAAQAFRAELSSNSKLRSQGQHRGDSEEAQQISPTITAERRRQGNQRGLNSLKLAFTSFDDFRIRPIQMYAYWDSDSLPALCGFPFARTQRPRQRPYMVMLRTCILPTLRSFIYISRYILYQSEFQLAVLAMPQFVRNAPQAPGRSTLI
jgi:hypothetical protein